MPTLTITRTVTYIDPDTEQPYSMTARVTIECTDCDRGRVILSPSTERIIFSPQENSNFGGDLKWVFIKNVGSNSAYISFNGGNHAMVEIPAGCAQDFFGSEIWDGAIGSPAEFSALEAKGDTEIEYDAFS